VLIFLLIIFFILYFALKSYFVVTDNEKNQVGLIIQRINLKGSFSSGNMITINIKKNIQFIN
jgi:hypothetical protein